MRVRLPAVVMAVLALVLLQAARSANSRRLKEDAARPAAVLAQASAGQSGADAFEGPERDPGDQRGCGRDLFKETFRNPPEVFSHNGALNTTLTIRREPMVIAGQKVVGNFYNHMYIPPVYHVMPGDVLTVEIVNHFDQMTNLHHHGSIVSPLGNGDNVFVDIVPGEHYQQVINFPPDHPPGMLWYHPHMHGLVEGQIFGGMSGGLIVDGCWNRSRSCAGSNTASCCSRISRTSTARFRRKARSTATPAPPAPSTARWGRPLRFIRARPSSGGSAISAPI